MANIQIDINGRQYGIGCDDGQEEHVTRLARHFDYHIRNLTASVGQIGDQKLFLMGAILLADEAHELRLKLDATEAELARIRDVRSDSGEKAQKERSIFENEINRATQIINTAANSFENAQTRIEKVIATLKSE